MRRRKVIKLVVAVLVAVCLFGVLRLFVEPDVAFTRTYFLQDKQRRRAGSDHDTVQTGDLTVREVVRRRFQHRRALLDNACRLYANSSLIRPHKPTKFEPIPLYKPIMNVTVRYCAIAKAASTTWGGYFAAIKNHMTSRGIKPSIDWNLADDEVYFTFVREPYARLWSAYVDKLLTPNEMFWRIAGKFIVRNFRKGASKTSRDCGHDVTFPEFIKYVIHTQKTGQHRNDHFIPIHDHCDLCHIPYRYIGHLETLAEDMPYITAAIQSPIPYNGTYDTDTIRQNANMVFLKSRKKRVQLCMDLDEASRRLWKKYQIRGLISKRERFPYPAHAAVNISREQFMKAALKAYHRCKHCVDRKAQREESLREAFAQISIEDRLQLQQTLFLDFQMFGFDPYLEDVFPQRPHVKDKKFGYLNIY